MRRSRLLYSAVVRPTMVYGAQVWSAEGGLAKATQAPLQDCQNRCLRRITGGYKRTPIAALERETGIPPLDIYTDTISLQRASQTRDHPIESKIRQISTEIWTSLRANTRHNQARPRTGQEKAQERAQEKEIEIQGFLTSQKEIAAAQAHQSGRRPRRQRRHYQQGGHQHQYKATTLISIWGDLVWRQRWERKAYGQKATTWRNPWKMQVLPLYENLTKAEATALFLLRTEILGLNAWLASVHVPEVLPRCPCGWGEQTVQHIFSMCRSHDRTRLIQDTQDLPLIDLLSQPETARSAVRWFLQQNLLPQFRLAQALSKEDTQDYSPFLGISQWTDQE
jgi:hypothetical protein